MSDSYFLKLDKFEGPLDLLLHLIKSQEMDIFTINLYEIASQYLLYLRRIRFRHLAEAAGFIEMAASLIEMKSRLLLPHEENKNADEILLQEEEIGDEEKLRQRLLWFETYRNAGQYLDQMTISRKTYPSYSYLYWEDRTKDFITPIRGDSHTLLVLYEQMLATLTDRRPTRVKAVKDSVLLEQVIDSLVELLAQVDILWFQSLYNKIESRYELVVHVLALLQLVHDKKIRIFQESLKGPLWLYRNDSENEDINLLHEKIQKIKSDLKSGVLNTLERPLEITPIA